MKAIASMVLAALVAAASAGGNREAINTRDEGSHADPSRLFPAEKRMLDIKLPDVDFRAATVPDIFECLDDAVKRYGRDREQEETTRIRLKFVGSRFNPGRDDESPIVLTFGGRDISLYDALRVCCALGQLDYRIEGNTVIVTNRNLDTHRLDVELRMSDKSAALPVAENTKFALFYSGGQECRYPPKRNGDVLTQSLPISRQSCRAVVVAFSNAPAQVFELAIPETPQTQPWSSWQPPAYFASTNMWAMNQSGDFPVMVDEATGKHLMSEPHLELRFRIEPWDPQTGHSEGER